MEKLLLSIWCTVLLYCEKVNEVALHPNDYGEGSDSKYETYYTKLEDMKHIIENAEGTLDIQPGEETQSDITGSYFEPIQHIEMSIAGEHKRVDFFPEW